MSRLPGKIALITGAASGIGEGIARAFVAEGAFVILSDLQRAQVSNLAKSLGPSTEYCHLDVRQEPAWIAVIDSILQNHGKLDILVNNAGITGFEGATVPHDPEHATLADWHAVLATNLDGTFLGCKHAIRAMRPRAAGSIINISSRSGLVGIPGASAYAASKAAVRNHTKTVALYCCQQAYPIRCNSVHPAAILTPMWEPMLGTGPDRGRAMAEIAKDIPMQKMGTAEDVASAVLFL